MSPGLLSHQRAAWVRNHATAFVEVLTPTVTTNARGGQSAVYRQKIHQGRNRWRGHVNGPTRSDQTSADRPDTALDAQISLEWGAQEAIDPGSLLRVVGGEVYEITSSETDRGQALRVILSCRRIEGIQVID